MTESSTRLTATATATAYDTWAVRYADLVRDELDGLPLDRAVLAAFADYVRGADGAAGSPRRVVELGCASGGHLLIAFFESGGGPVAEFDHKVAPAFRWPIDDLAQLAGEAGFAEVGRMLREPRTQERFRRGHLMLRRR